MGFAVEVVDVRVFALAEVVDVVEGREDQVLDVFFLGWRSVVWECRIGGG